ncbi:hypothetical protein AIIKEEIJ_06308 [Rhodococcus sp. YH1]|nr:hypothetical protein [Rhodococcus sp. YH1]NCL78797.1 hypothetical protein [Rhodococcus sp. YH1]
MLPPEAGRYWADQQRTTAALVIMIRRLWRRMGSDFDASWQMIEPILLMSVLQAQESIAVRSAAFIPEVVDALNIDVAPEGAIVPDAVVGVTGDGRPVDALLAGGPIAAKRAITAGATETVALETGGRWLELAVKTLISDTGRAVESVGVAARPGVGYVRMLNPPSCSRCVILAGRFYRYNRGFLRHPGCDCRHIPSRESMAGDLRIDPDRYFHSLPASEQDRIFTKAGAEVIREGADINQVVNARSGMSTAQTNLAGWIPKGRLSRTEVYGQMVETTTAGITRRGVAYRAMSRAGYAQRQTDVRTGRYFQARAPRLMPESILRLADDRADAIRLLKLYGYMT